MKFQPGVRTDGVGEQIWWAMGMADMLHRQIFAQEAEITSANDQHEHKPKSLHNRGMAFDLRTRHMSKPQRMAYYKRLKAQIDPHGFDTVDERNHIHVEYDPKKGEEFVGSAED
jgi:hypothetical protein